jgi:hypothetical protein
MNAKLASFGITGAAYISVIEILAGAPEPFFTKVAAVVLIIGCAIVVGISIVIAWNVRNNCIKKCNEKYGPKEK